MPNSTPTPTPRLSLADARDPDTPLPLPHIGDPPSLDLSVVIPAYNEAERLPPMLAEALRYLARARPRLTAELLVVDDGSTDGTAAVVTRVAREFGAGATAALRVLRQRPNAGKGAAVRAGMLAARGSRLLMADADAATRFTDVERLEAALSDGRADVAVGSRKLASSAAEAGGGGGGVGGGVGGVGREGGGGGLQMKAGRSEAERSPFRALLSFVFHLVVVVVAGVSGVRDTQCGFKLFTRRAARAAFDGQRLERWAFDVENLYRVQRAGLNVVEVPVHWTEVPGSKISVVKATLNMLFDMVRMRLHYVSGRWALPARVSNSSDWHRAV